MKPKLLTSAALLIAVLFAPSAAGATLILFDDYSNNAPGTTGLNEVDYIGEFSQIGNTPGLLFSVAFGDCDYCLYDRPVGIGSFPNGTGPFHEIVMAHNGSNTQMNYYPKSRTFDSFVGAYGSYCVADFDKGCPYHIAERVPEPKGLWLLVAGIFLARWCLKRIWS